MVNPVTVIVLHVSFFSRDAKRSFCSVNIIYIDSFRTRRSWWCIVRRAGLHMRSTSLVNDPTYQQSK